MPAPVWATPTESPRQSELFPVRSGRPISSVAAVSSCPLHPDCAAAELTVALCPGSACRGVFVVLAPLFHLVDVPPQTFVLVPDVLELEHVLDALQQLDLVDRLAEEVIGAGFDGPLDVACFVQGGDHQDHDLPRGRV